MSFKRLLPAAFSAAIILVSFGGAFAAIDPDLSWKTISTEHFDVHFHEGEEWTAERVAEIAEEIYPHITGVYNYEPGRVSFIVKDTEDYANGAAYYYDNKVEIWATNLEFDLRGTTEWLRNVVTHEYTHIVSIQASMKMPTRFPSLYFQLIGFEEEKRPDVLTGYPDQIVSYPFPGTTMPAWFAEGVAQYQSPDKKTDCWDTHRDMILRAGLLDNAMLSYDEMGFLGHTSLGNEEVYDHGYGLVNYIAATYGREAIERITRELGAFQRLSMDGALKKVTGKKGRELYDDWREYLRRRYDRQLQPVRVNPREGEVLCDEGYMTLCPTFSPDGEKVALLSNKGKDYAGTALYVIDRDGKNLKKIQDAVSSRGVFSPDGKKLLYARHRKADPYNAMQSDVHVYDFATKKEKRLTTRSRCAQPSFSPDGAKIVCVANRDGTHKLMVMDADGSKERVLFTGAKGTQFYNPVYSPDGSRILFGIFDKGTRDIAVIDADGGNFRYLVKSQNDERDARWLPGGDGIVFSCDRTGIFNVYSMSLDDRRFEQLTNVIGGAFAPDVSAKDGSLVYAGYRGRGYFVAVIGPEGAPVAELDETAYYLRTMGDLDDCTGLKGRTYARAGEAAAPSAVITDAAGPAADASPVEKDYKQTYTEFQVFPRVVIYDGTPRLGAFIASREILDKQDFFVGGSYGTNGEFDAFIDLQFRNLLPEIYVSPTLYMQFMVLREHFEDHTEFDNLKWNLDIRYDLWAADIGVRFELEDVFNLAHRHDISLWFSHSEYRVHIDPYYFRAGAWRPVDPVAWKYYIGNDWFAQYYVKSIKPSIDSDINPRGGRELRLKYMLAQDKLFTSGEFEYGFNPVFDKNIFNQYTVDWIEYVALPWWRHSLRLRAFGSFIDKKVDDFFWVYLGGLDGIRGYTYYTIGGRKGVIGSATYRFPIWRRINKQFLHLTFKDIYGGVLFETANAWKANFDPDDFKSSAGFELRLNLGSFYSYPTTVGLTSAYSLDEVVFFNPAFSRAPVLHEKKFRHYLTVGFTF